MTKMLQLSYKVTEKERKESKVENVPEEIMTENSKI